MTKEEKQTAWSIEELIALTDEVQNASVDYRGKDFDFHFCELVEEEEPKMGSIPEDADDDEKMAHYSKIGNQRIVAMIEKANKKNPEGVTVSTENWDKLPSTIRWGLSQAVLGGGTNFREVDE